MRRKVRKRGPQFTEQERQLLVYCILKEPDIENRKQDGETNKRKNKAWERVTKEFNKRTNEFQREQFSLRCCWKSMKVKLRKASLDDVNNGGTSDGGILSLLKSSSNLIVTLENTSDGEQSIGPEESLDSDMLETDYLELSHSASEHSNQSAQSSHSVMVVESEQSVPYQKSPTPAPALKIQSKGSSRSLLTRVANEKLKYIRWKKEQKEKIFELKMKTQQALLDEATARRDMILKETNQSKVGTP